MPDLLPVVVSRRLSEFTSRVTITVGGHTYWNEGVEWTVPQYVADLHDAWYHMLSLCDHRQEQRKNNAVRGMEIALQTD